MKYVWFILWMSLFFYSSRPAQATHPEYAAAGVSVVTLVGVGPLSVTSLIGNIAVMAKGSQLRVWSHMGLISSGLGIIGHFIGLVMMNKVARAFNGGALTVHIFTLGLSIANLVRIEKIKSTAHFSQIHPTYKNRTQPPLQNSTTLLVTNDVH